MMQQYYSIKKEYPDMILFFRLGDFYEMFDEDAKIASPILGVALTTRNKNADNPTPLCGIPFHAADQYIIKLLKQGLKVAICDQIEDPKKATGLVKRKVVKVMTPGVIANPDYLDDKSNNYLAGIEKNNQGYLFGFIDVSTNQFQISQLSCLEELLDELLRIAPQEILLGVKCGREVEQFLSENSKLRNTTLSRPTQQKELNREELFKIIFNQFGEQTSSMDENIFPVAALIINYLQETLPRSLDHIKSIGTYQTSSHLELDEATRRNLEIFSTGYNFSKEGTLLSILDKTLTSMGGRLLKSWLLFPLKSKRRILERLGAVESIYNFPHVQQALSKNLRQFSDIERLGIKISSGTVTPRDLVRLKESLRLIPELKEILSSIDDLLLGKTNKTLNPLSKLVSILDKAFDDEAPVNTRSGGFIKAGFNPELDELRNLVTNSKGILAALETREREQTGITTLRVRFNNVFGYYIEVSKAKSDLVPNHYIRKQTLTNSERYFTDELKDYEDKILTAQDKMQTLEMDLFNRIITEIVGFVPELCTQSNSVATLDIIHSFASISAKWNYHKPSIIDSGAIKIVEGRHPVIEQQLASTSKEAFVPNDIFIDPNKEQILLITGPNMAGKSTIMRQTALCSLMTQIGCFVPAEEAQMSIVDKIFTRVGASDNLLEGHSTFMVEMLETANILKNATSSSLILLDEIGRGTSTYDGVSIAWSVIEAIHDIKANTLFATHYHELTTLSNDLERLQNYQVLVEENQGQVKFVRKLARGAVNKSYGIQVAELAGLPKEVTQRAFTILDKLENGKSQLQVKEADPTLLSHSQPEIQTAIQFQANLFGEQEPPAKAALADPLHKEMSTILDYPVERRTPLDAMNFIAKVQKRLKHQITLS